MAHSKKTHTYVAAMVALAMIGVFAPDFDSTLLSSSRVLVSEDQESRALQSVPERPAVVDVTSCDAGQETYTMNWGDIVLDPSLPSQTLTMSNGLKVTLSVSTTGVAKLDQYSQFPEGWIVFGLTTIPKQSDLITPNVVGSPNYPESYITMDLEFDRDLHGLMISIGDIDSTNAGTDAVRIRMFDGAGNPAYPLTFSSTGSITVKDDFAYEIKPNNPVENPGYSASLYARATGNVRKIRLDQSLFVYKQSEVGKQFSFRRGVFPALDFVYCDLSPEPITESPVTPAPVTVAPVAPTPDSGVNGDPLIMGLSGQLFNFEGRSGAWYSAVSSPSFQWNMQIQNYETCPKHSNSFVSGAGFTFLNASGDITARIEANVVNAYNVDVGCGSGAESCLGAGSLELIIDGIKHTTGGDFRSKDGSTRILAFNTFYHCSRKWYDFEVRSKDNTKAARRLGKGTPSPVFEVIDSLKNTMIGEEQCEQWIQDRKQYGDLFEQPGHYSTVIVETADITLHLEYKQENERCNAHSIDVWISSVSPSLMAEPWEGVIGETKDPSFKFEGEQRVMDRHDALKYSSDTAYEVNAPFTTHCRGCYHN